MDIPTLDPTNPAKTLALAESLENTTLYYARGFLDGREPWELGDEKHLTNLYFMKETFTNEFELYSIIASCQVKPEKTCDTIMGQYVTEEFLKRGHSKKDYLDRSDGKEPLDRTHLSYIIISTNEFSKMLRTLASTKSALFGDKTRIQEIKARGETTKTNDEISPVKKEEWIEDPVIDASDPRRVLNLADCLEDTAAYYTKGYRTGKEPWDLGEEKHMKNLYFVDHLSRESSPLYEIVASQFEGEGSLSLIRERRGILRRFLSQYACQESGLPTFERKEDRIGREDIPYISACVQNCTGMLRGMVLQQEDL